MPTSESAIRRRERSASILAALAACLGVAALAGCEGAGFFEPPAADRDAAPVSQAPAAAHTAAPADAEAGAGEVMAYVNGEAINMRPLYDVLLRSYGLEASQRLVAAAVIRQEARRQGITITDSDIRDETDRTLERIFGTVESSEQRERMLEQFLERFELTHEQWQLTVRMNAYLTKLAEPQVTVSDRELRDEFNRQYERKVVIRHIQTASLAQAQDILRKLEAGADFESLAFRYSTNASGQDGGLLPAIGPNTTGVPPAIRQAALAMNSVGEISEPVQVGSTYHVLRLEEIIPPRDVELDAVRAQVAAAVRARKLDELKGQIRRDLFARANVEYVNPTLEALRAQAEREANRD